MTGSSSAPRFRPFWAQPPGPNPLVQRSAAHKVEDPKVVAARLRLLGSVTNPGE